MSSTLSQPRCMVHISSGSCWSRYEFLVRVCACLLVSVLRITIYAWPLINSTRGDKRSCLSIDFVNFACAWIFDLCLSSQVSCKYALHFLVLNSWCDFECSEMVFKNIFYQSSSISTKPILKRSSFQTSYLCIFFSYDVVP